MRAKSLLIIASIGLPSAVMADDPQQAITIQIRPKPLQILLGQLTADCSWPIGQQVFAPSTSGGDGTPIIWALTQPGTDFAVNATTGAITIGPNGIAPANCGTTENVTLTATQP